ncbi:MAG: adenylate/guanylate cyclase domain-containing protein [Pseudomonadota bacterium]
MSVSSYQPFRRPSLVEQVAALFSGRQAGRPARRDRIARSSSKGRVARTTVEMNPAREPAAWVGMRDLSPAEAEAWRPIVELAAELDAEPDICSRPRPPTASPAVLDRLLADPSALGDTNETRDVTVLFADVRGFTGFAEALKDDPRRLADLICGILDPLSEVVLAHGGTIDKYMGDCVMAFWGAPDHDPDHAQRAFEAARAMIPAMDAVNQWVRAAFSDLDLPRIEIGIGVNSGACVVGNVGGRRRYDYSVLGDPVNVASRLEGLCKTYETPLILGEETASRLPIDAGLVELDQVALRGRAGQQRVYGLASA